MNAYEAFLEKFAFAPEKAGQVGMEVEGFLVDESNNLAPLSPLILGHCKGDERFAHELAAFQIETRAACGPVPLPDIISKWRETRDILIDRCTPYQVRPVFQGAWMGEVPLAIYPDPNGYYAGLTSLLSDDQIKAASSVCGLHVHIGMGSHTQALRAYNHACTQAHELLLLGNESGGARMERYMKVINDPFPPSYEDWKEVHRIFQQHNFDVVPRRCWHLIRLSVHGSVEFRMFDSSDNLDHIRDVVTRCHRLCMEAVA